MIDNIMVEKIISIFLDVLNEKTKDRILIQETTKRINQQESAKNDKKENKKIKIKPLECKCYEDKDGFVEENKSKLDEAEEFRNNNFTWMHNTYSLSFPLIEAIGELVFMYREAIKEMQSQKEFDDSAWESLLKERNDLLEIIQQKDEDIIEERNKNKLQEIELNSLKSQIRILTTTLELREEEHKYVHDLIMLFQGNDKLCKLVGIKAFDSITKGIIKYFKNLKPNVNKLD